MFRMSWLFLMEVCVSYCLNFRQSGHGHGSFNCFHGLELYGKLLNFSLFLSRNSKFPALVENSELELFIVKMS